MIKKPNRIKILLIIFLFIASISSQDLIKKSGVSIEIIGGRLDVLNMHGPQYGVRVGFWPTSFLKFGVSTSVAHNLNNESGQNFDKFHAFSSLHLRLFKYFHPYVIGTVGKQIELAKNDHNYDDNLPNNFYLYKNGVSVKVGLAFEFNQFLLAIETGGGSFGSGHVENNIGLSYVFKQIPQSRKLSNFNVKAGYHTIFPFSGPYDRENIPGFDIILEIKGDSIIREYNAGIFFTDYIFSTGVFNIGTGWRLQGDNPIFEYLDITPGIQALIWVEGEPDFILPAVSLGIGTHTELGRLIPFINTRTLLSYSKADDILLGTTLTVGLGFSF